MGVRLVTWGIEGEQGRGRSEVEIQLYVWDEWVTLQMLYLVEQTRQHLIKNLNGFGSSP